MTKPDFNDRMLSLGLARVSEAAALASAKLIGRGDEKAADQAAVNAMREQLNRLDIEGVDTTKTERMIRTSPTRS